MQAHTTLKTAETQPVEAFKAVVTDIEQLRSDFIETRRRTNQIMSMVTPDGYKTAGIPLRHPVVFYDGHFDAFLYNTLFKRVLKRPSVNAHLEDLFERGIDPRNVEEARMYDQPQWPSYGEVRHFKSQVWCALLDLFDQYRDQPEEEPNLLTRLGLQMVFEHELMHQETLLYIIHQLPQHLKQAPQSYNSPVDAPLPKLTFETIPGGEVLMGAQAGEYPFVWDNEQWAEIYEVDEFDMQTHNVTNAEFMAFVEAGGYDNPKWWSDKTWAWKETLERRHPLLWQPQGSSWAMHGMFETHPLPLSWPAMVTQAEAEAFCRFVGRRLPTAHEWMRAAYGNHHHWRYPLGLSLKETIPGNVDFASWTLQPVGSDPESESPYGVMDLWSNGWEWTATPFAPYEGFEPSPLYPQYSADFFDDEHYLVCGGSPYTDKRLLRRSFRNWFYWHYPYMVATFRTVESA